MRHWREDYFRMLRDLSATASRVPQWADYAAFCSEYESGLRSQAFATLDTFIRKMQRAPFSERRHFVSWLMTSTHDAPGRHMAVPHPLRVNVIEPTLLEWTVVEPDCSEPHRWLGGYEHLKSAIEADANDEIARRKLVALILGSVDYSTHELPRGYIGEPSRDLAALEEAAELVSNLMDQSERQDISQEIEELRLRVLAYLRSR